MELQFYLNFNGNAEQALNFYKTCLNGEILSLQHFGDSPMPVSEENKKKVLHAVFKFGNNVVMASDCMPDNPAIIGNNISLSMNFQDEKEMEKVYKNLVAGGKETMPLQDTFWGARFGMLEDKFGINWMFNCDKKK